jgi:hypothetical protein
LEDRLKKTLRAISLETRHILEGQNGEAGDLEQQLNRLGIWRNRSKPLEEMPHLSTEDREARRVVEAYLDFRQDADVARENAVAEFIRESAYTWANRLFALRIMEARGIIDEVILKKEVYSGRSLVQNRFAKKNPDACRREDDGLFAVLFNEFQERSRDLPDLFNPVAPVTKLRPSVAALKRIVALLSGLEKPKGQDPATDEVFEASDAFGWMYQYWNLEEKDKVFEKLRTAKGFKIQGSDIISATQLYTEPYMVKFLVQNSLGATWMSMHPESKLFEKWEYYFKDADRISIEKKPISEITFMDPASGSGHFHIEAFDLFYEMYEEEGVLIDPKEICTTILNRNLFGIDIDERAVQITKAVLWMKALERAPDLDGTKLKDFHDNIISTNIILPKGKDQLEAFLEKHPDDMPLKFALETVLKGLEDVDELGSLIQIEGPVERALDGLKSSLILFGKDAGWNVWKREVILHLKEHFSAESQTIDLTQSLFGSSASQGLALFDLLSQRYDVVATNPPYMGSKNMGASIKKYVETHYRQGKRDLYAAFILRCLELTRTGGRMGMVTQQSWMFLRSYADLRAEDISKKTAPKKTYFKGLLRETTFETLVHLGPGAFGEISGEVVNVALFTLANVAPLPEHRMIAFRLNRPRTPEDKKSLLIQWNKSDQFEVNQSDLTKINRSPIVYDLPKVLLYNAIVGKKLEERAYVRQGVATTNNDRFLRSIAEITDTDKRWMLYHKGGGYGRWVGFETQYINWENDGALIKTNIDSRPDQFVWQMRMPHSDIFFLPGLVYSLISRGSLSVRIIEKSVFDVASPFIKIPPSELLLFSAFLNSKIVSFLLRKLVQDLKFHAGYLFQLPLPNELDQLKPTADILAPICYQLKILEIETDLLEVRANPNAFEANGLSLKEKTKYLICNKILFSAFRHTIEGSIEEIVFNLYSSPKGSNTANTVIEELGSPVGWLPLISKYDSLPEPKSVKLSFARDVLAFTLALDHNVKNSSEILKIKQRLRTLYEIGPGVKTEDKETYDESLDDEEMIISTHISTPVETFLEELSNQLEIHPISVYCLLKEGIEQEGWRCIPEEQRITKDKFTVIILHLLGHRWPKQIEASELLPYWADKDGIIPLTEGSGEKILLERVRERIEEEFPGGKVRDIEREFEEIMETSLEKWLAGPFFKHHISQFKKRPIAWQIESRPPEVNSGLRGRGRGAKRAPVFSCLVYYHKLDGDLLHKIRTQYVWNLRDHFETELRTLEDMGSPTNVQLERLGNLRRWIEELKDFDARLEEVSQNGFDCIKLKDITNQEPLDKWTSRDGQATPPTTEEEFYIQEKRYDPDINEGVRVNIAPLQIAGLLAADVLAKKDPEKSIQDRCEWRADERRWCRQGKLPRLGWWMVEK